MNQAQSGAQAPPQPAARAESPPHRRGSDVERPGRPAQEREDEDRLQSDDAAEVEQSPESPPVDETDVLSSAGPDSLEDIEDDDGDDIER